LNSKNHEEVRKRRAKATTRQLNLCQKTVLVAGVLALFLAIGLSPQLAPLLASGVAAGTLLLFLIFKNLKTKKEGKNNPSSQEIFPEGEETSEAEPISSRGDGEIIADSSEVISERTNSDVPRESMPPEPEEAIPPTQPLPVQKEDFIPTQEFSRDGALPQIQERLAMLEEKILTLEDKLLSLEEKLPDMQETQLKSDPPIDLQTILTNLDEKRKNGAVRHLGV
jgi:hypothetical protein